MHPEDKEMLRAIRDAALEHNELSAWASRATAAAWSVIPAIRFRRRGQRDAGARIVGVLRSRGETNFVAIAFMLREFFARLCPSAQSKPTERMSEYAGQVLAHLVRP
jgi:hypothetical protein